MDNRIHLCIILAILYHKVTKTQNKTTVKMSEKTSPKLLDLRQIQYPLHVPLPSYRRQGLLQMFENLVENLFQKKVRQRRPETIYEPYWIGGHWVYYRTTRFPRKKFTTKPPPTTPWSSTSSTTTTMRPGETKTTPWINYMCQHPCLGLFEDFGIVCGQRYDGIEYEMRQFTDACDLYNANCINPHTKPSYWQRFRGPWYILYRGPCHELTTTFLFHPYYNNQIISRGEYYMSVVAYNKLMSVYLK